MFICVDGSDCRGETGSGKSTTSKLFLTQILNVSHEYSRRISQPAYQGKSYPPDTRLITRLVASIQLIELLGHAQTPLNPHASRVHKYTELQFSKIGKLIGAKIVDFMLEKRRVAQAFKFSRYERNFHIFYELFAAGQLSREDKEKMHLLDGYRSYKYLVPAESGPKFKKLYDADALNPSGNIKKILFNVGFNQKSQDDILKILSAIILLGNIEFAVYEARKQEGRVVFEINDFRRVCEVY